MRKLTVAWPWEIVSHKLHGEILSKKKGKEYDEKNSTKNYLGRRTRNP